MKTDWKEAWRYTLGEKSILNLPGKVFFAPFLFIGFLTVFTCELLFIKKNRSV